MGSGLIWAGIGKGIADAGASYGNAMLRDIEAREADERAERRAVSADERAMQRTEALEKLKAEREEAKLKRDADIYAQAEANAPGIGDQRRFDQFKKDVGETAMSDDDLRKVFDDQYNQRKVGSFEGADRYREKFSREKEDVLNEIRRLGGSSTAIKEARESYRATVDAENKAEERARNDRIDERRERESRERSQNDATRAEASLRQAAAAEARANRPPTATDNRERLTTMINSANATIKSLNDGPRGKTPEEKAEWQRQMDEAKWLRDKATQQLKQSFDDKPVTPPEKPKGGDNGNVKPGAYKVGETRTVQSGPNKGKTAQWDGQGWVLK